jgi:hypothetical protein
LGDHRFRPDRERLSAATAVQVNKAPEHDGGQGDSTGMILLGIASSKSMVAKDGIEPPTHGFSVRCSTN